MEGRFGQQMSNVSISLNGNMSWAKLRMVGNKKINFNDERGK